MEGGSELFASYEADFKLVFAGIRQKVSQIPELVPGSEARKAAINAAERAIDEADEIVTQMSLEINNIPSTAKTKPRQRLRNYSSELDAARGSLLKFAQNADRDALFGDRRDAAAGAGAGAGADAVASQRQQLLRGTQSLERSSQRLLESERIARDTESIGASILGDLSAQRDQIVHTHNSLNDSERYLDRSIKTLRGMARRYFPF